MPPASRRIAHVTDFYLPRLGGIERHVSDLARAQRAAGDVVDVITSWGKVEGNDLVLDVSARSSSTYASFSPSSITAARDAVLGGSYDVVHVHVGLATPLAFTVASAASRAGIPTVATMHSMVSALDPVYRLANTLIGWRRWPVTWTAVSRVAANQLQHIVRGDATVAVLPNAVDVASWRGHTPEPHEGVVVTAVMRLAARKRPLPLLEMLERVRQDVPADIPLTLNVIGDGGQRAAVERFVRRHHMESWVRVHGACDHARIREIFQRSDVFVAPAMLESFGIAALEARAAGLPVVAFAQSGIAEFIEHEMSGLLATDDGEMVAALVRLASDGSLRSMIAAHNGEFAPDFGWDESRRRTDVVYRTAERSVAVRHGAASCEPTCLFTSPRPIAFASSAGAA